MNEVKTQYSSNKEICCFKMSIVCATLSSCIACLSRTDLDCKKENMVFYTKVIRKPYNPFLGVLIPLKRHYIKYFEGVGTKIGRPWISYLNCKDSIFYCKLIL